MFTAAPREGPSSTSGWVFPTPEHSSKQSSDPVVLLVPCTGIFQGPSKSGKTVALILERKPLSSVLRLGSTMAGQEVHRGGMNTEKEQAYWEDWDEAALRGIIQRQRKITETSKKLEMKKLHQVLIIWTT